MSAGHSGQDQRKTHGGVLVTRPIARVPRRPSTGGSSGCAPRPHVLCRPSSPGPGGGSRTPLSPSLSRALEKVASFGLWLWSGLAHRCPDAWPARESPASRGVEGLAALALAGSPRGPSLLPGSQMGLLAGALPAAARLEDAPRPPSAAPRVRAGIQGLGCPCAAWLPGRGQRAAGEEPRASGGCRNPLRHTSGRWGDPYLGTKPGSTSLLVKEEPLGEGGTEPRAQAHRHRLEGATPWGLLFAPASHGVFSPPAGTR